MRHGDEQAKESLAPSAHRGPDRSAAWMQLTYDYLGSLSGQLDDVMGLLQARDHAGIRRLAHRAKGTSGTYALRSIAENFAQLEQAVRTNSHGDVPALVATIRRLIEVEAERLRPRLAPSDRDQNGDPNG